MLSRWLAEYISQQIAAADSAKGAAKALAEERCTDAILKLWNHRASFPSGIRPFENFEGIFKILERLDPENPKTFYRFEGLGAQEPEKPTDTSQQWLKKALGIDGAAKALIKYSLEKAAESASSAKSLAWFKEAIGLLDASELEVLIQFVKTGEREKGTDPEKALREKFEKAVRAKIAHLDDFIKQSKKIRESLLADLKAGPRSQNARLHQTKSPKAILPKREHAKNENV